MLLVVILRDNRGTILLVVSIVHKKIVLLGINDCLNKFSGMVSFPLQDVDDDIHDLWTKTWESKEDLLND